MEDRDYLNQQLAEGCVLITQDGLLSQSFQTADNAIEVIGTRVGGGFTVGKTIYKMSINKGPYEVTTLRGAYKATADYLRREKI